MATNQRVKKARKRAQTLKQKIVVLRNLLRDKDMVHIITALRGPDSAGNGVKYRTTTFIRRAVLGPKAVHHPAVECLWAVNTLGDKISFGGLDDKIDCHFIDHIRRAAEVLGLEIEGEEDA